MKIAIASCETEHRTVHYIQSITHETKSYTINLVIQSDKEINKETQEFLQNSFLEIDYYSVLALCKAYIKDKWPLLQDLEKP